MASYLKYMKSLLKEKVDMIRNIKMQLKQKELKY